jgi:uncharacterized membrane protein
MKRTMSFLVILLLIALGAGYFIIPGDTTIVTEIAIKAPMARTGDLLARQNFWAKWWPLPIDSNHAAYNGTLFRVDGREGNVIETQIIHKDLGTLSGRILMAGPLVDSTGLEWSVTTNLGSGPLARVKNYFAAKKLKSDMDAVLRALKKFAERQENIYGMAIEKTRVTDTVLVATRAGYDHYPNTEDIYKMVDKLKAYIESENATETNAPMLNIQRVDSSHFEAMVAIPTNRLLNDKGDIKQKRMVPGNIIWGQVKGGQATVEYALQQLENYKYDNRLTSPAIPFALLLTDRRAEPDTSKWITRVYYPIF